MPPVCTAVWDRSEWKYGERGAKTTRDSPEENRLEDGFTAAGRCAKRLARESERARERGREIREG